MDIKTIVYMFDSVNDCNEQSCDGIYTNLVQEFNNLFNIKIASGKMLQSLNVPRRRVWMIVSDQRCGQFGDDFISLQSNH